MTWRCSRCGAALHLAGTLWRSPDEDPYCDVVGSDPIAEQYAAAGVSVERPARSRALHMARSGWVHPSMREES